MKTRLFTSAAALLLTSLALHAEGEPASVLTISPTVAKDSRPYQVPGRTEAFESATIFTRATGIIRERKFEIGDVVKAGDVLAVVDAQEIDRAVDAARAGVDQAKARAKNARTLAERAAKLHQSQTMSREEYEQRAATALEDDAAVRVAEAELARYEEQQRFATVRAPFDAVVAARNFDRGDHVRGDSSTADGWLYRLVRLDTLRFAISASPDLALRLGSDATAKVFFREFPGKAFPAKVAHSSRVFDSASGTMRVELLLENKDLSMPAGLTGTAAFDLSPVEGTYLVPTNTVFVREGKTTLAAVEDGKVKFVEVLPGRNLGPNMEVTSAGLNTETQVVINPNAMLRPGDAVQITSRQAGR